MTAARGPVAGGAVLVAAGIALGAFAAHGLKTRLDPVALDWWRTGVDYQMWNAIGLVALGAAGVRGRSPGWLIAGGTLVFSGTLYLMALGGPRWLGAVTPIGGASMMAGWVMAAWAVWRRA